MPTASRLSRLLLTLSLILGSLAAHLPHHALAASPPNLLPYQGRLTGSSNAPITNTRTVIFSLWRGGSATAANSGTEFYRESVSITPDNNGIFEHMIGSGAVLSGSLTAAGFNTADPVYIQVAVDSVGNVLLPRARAGSVGYAMVAEYASASGSPQVTSVVDVTGGLTVVGDRIQINGSGLSSAGVTIGGLKAPISSRTATQIEVQVPAGVKTGPNAVEVSENEAGGKAVVVHHLDVRRLVAGLASGGSGALVIFDSKDGAVLMRDTSLASVDSGLGPLQMAYGNNGSLLLVPSGTSNTVYAYDMTLNPPARRQSKDMGGDVYALAISPDNVLAVASVQDSSRLRPFLLTESKPPYSSNVMGNFTGNLTNLPSGFNPRGSTWVGDTLFMAVGANTSQIISYRRYPPATAMIYEEFDNGNGALVHLTSTSPTPRGLTLTPDGTRVFVTGVGPTGNVNGHFVSMEGFSSMVSGAAGGQFASAMAISPEGNWGLVADSQQDLLHSYYLHGATAILAGDLEGPSGSTAFSDAAIEPVTGDRAVAGTTNSSYQLFVRKGASLQPLASISTTGSSRRSMAVAFQP